jgi:hypothetical protein
MPTVAHDFTYYIDHTSTDPTFTPGSFISFKPENLAWDEQIRGVGNCSYQISFSALDVDGAVIVSGHDFIGPMRSWFRLRYGDVVIMSGPIVSSERTSFHDDFMSVAGKTWEHYFERWQYPFDPRFGPPDHTFDFQHPNTYNNNELIGSGAATPDGLAYQAFNRDLIRILGDIIPEVMNVGNRITFDLSSLSGLSGIRTNMNLSLGDDSYLDSIINTLWIGHDMAFHWATPYRFGNPTSPAIYYTIDSSHIPIDLGFTNNGPAATHVLGKGAGLASQTTLGRAYGYLPGQVQFSRLDASYDFGDIRSFQQLINLTQKQLSRDLQPQHVITLKVDPYLITDYWLTFRIGRAIYIDYEMIFHMIDSPQQIKSYSATMDPEGGVLVDITLDQIYALSINTGTPEG